MFFTGLHSWVLSQVFPFDFAFSHVFGLFVHCDNFPESASLHSQIQFRFIFHVLCYVPVFRYILACVCNYKIGVE